MEPAYQYVTADSHVEGNPVVEVGEEFTYYDNPLVQQPPMADTTFHFLMKGQPGSLDWVFNHPSDDTIGIEFGTNSPFWRTSIGKSISEYGTTKPEPSVLTALRKSLRYALSNAKLF